MTEGNDLTRRRFLIGATVFGVASLVAACAPAPPQPTPPSQPAASTPAAGGATVAPAAGNPTAAPAPPTAAAKPTAAAAVVSQPGGTLTVDTGPVKIKLLDPNYYQADIERTTTQLIAEPLLYRDADFKLVPGLATSWQELPTTA